MEKLINLYYEHKLDLLKIDMRVNGATEREIEMADIEKVEEEELEENLNKLSDLKPFIKWLVDNDKIDIHNIPPISITKGEEGTAYNEPVMLDDGLLMLLSISSSPIEDLVSYLK